MRFEVYDGEWMDEHEISFILEEYTGSLIDKVNKMREKLGYTDIVSVGVDNDVYYNFYVMYRPSCDYVSVIAVCNNGEQDDWMTYDIKLSDNDMNELYPLVIHEYNVMEA